MLSSATIKGASDDFLIEREGKIIGSAFGDFTNTANGYAIEIFCNGIINDGDWLIHNATRKRCYVKNAHPQTNIKGEVYGYKIDYLSETAYNQKSEMSINIQNVNGPSIIGNQQNATINVGSSLDDVKNLISQVSADDKADFSELVEELESVESSRHPALIPGMLARFETLVNKYPNLLSTLGGWAVKLLIGYKP